MTYPVIPTASPQSAQDIANLIDADATAEATLASALGVNGPTPIGTALTDLTGLTLDQTERAYAINGADELSVSSAVAGSWMIITVTETSAGAITSSGITWMGGTDNNDIVAGCEVLLRCAADGTTIRGSVAVPTT